MELQLGVNLTFSNRLKGPLNEVVWFGCGFNSFSKLSFSNAVNKAAAPPLLQGSSSHFLIVMRLPYILDYKPGHLILLQMLGRLIHPSISWRGGGSECRLGHCSESAQCSVVFNYLNGSHVYLPSSSGAHISPVPTRWLHINTGGVHPAEDSADITPAPY